MEQTNNGSENKTNYNVANCDEIKINILEQNETMAQVTQAEVREE
jgi:hypothetical protein